MPIKSYTEEQIRDQATRVCESRAIGRAKTYKKLLCYLVERELSGQPPKEAEIASEVFDRRETQTDDAFVRVYIHNLRKKLENYYKSPDTRDEIRIHIPPGGYQVLYSQANEVKPVEHEQDTEASPPRRVALSRIGLALLTMTMVLSIALNAYLIHKTDVPQAQESRLANSFAWNELTTNGKPVLVVLGDFFVFYEQDEILKRRRTIRDVTINSTQDLENFLALHPERREKIRTNQSPYLNKSSAFALQQILPVFESGVDISFKLSSQVSPADIREKNVVFIGLYKTLGPLQGYFLGSTFQISPRFNLLKNKETGEKFSIQGDAESRHSDYGLFAKFEGPSDNAILIFASFTDTALMQMVKYLTDSQQITHIHEKLKEQSKYPVSDHNNFEVFFQASGYNRTDLNSEILMIAPVNHSAIWAAPKAK